MVGCSCAICRSSDPRNRRRRASVLLQEDDRQWIIDVGPDFRAQALDLGLESLDGVFLSHAHADHILGLDDLRPLSWKRTIPVWASPATLGTVRRAFPYFFSTGTSKNSRPRLEFHPLEPGQVVSLAGVNVLPVAIQHGDDQILGFRIGNLAYLTDCNGLPADSGPLLKGLDILILGALRASPHPTHFSVPEAVEFAQTLAPRQTWLTHFSHEIDHGTVSDSLPNSVRLAYDGLELSFSSE